MNPLDSLNVSEEQIVWRYFDLPKFVHLLESKSLFFSRLDLLGDPFEGSVTQADLTALSESWWSMSEQSGMPVGIYSEDHRLRERDPRHRIFVSCWHMSETESVAMWRIYADQIKGIAVKSSVKKLLAHLPNEGRIRRVEYLDYLVGKTAILSPVYCKRKAFEYECELRAVIPRDLNPAPAGLPLHIDLNSVIEEIRLAPDMPGWLADLVKKLLVRYGVGASCARSSLSDFPLFDWELGDA